MPTDDQISVVIPTRHRETALANCLTHLEPQLDANVEVIVSDDGRSARTRELIESRFPFARWTPGPQRGPAANRNHGAAQARGEFLLFLDDDVEPAPRLLLAYRSSLAEGVDVYEGRTTCCRGLRSPLEHAPANEHGGFLWSCNLMVRRTAWDAVGGFDEDFPHPHLEDVVFREKIRALERVARFVPAAAVDHPPRRVPPPHVLARYHEAYFIYHYKYLGRSPSLARFFSTLIHHRVRNVFSYPLSSDSLVSLGATSIESLHVLARWRGWNRRWKTARDSGVRLPDPF